MFGISRILPGKLCFLQMSCEEANWTEALHSSSCETIALAQCICFRPLIWRAVYQCQGWANLVVGGPFWDGNFLSQLLCQDGHCSAEADGGLCFLHGRTCPGGADAMGSSDARLDLFIAGFSCKSNSLQPLGELCVWLYVYMLPEAIIILPDWMMLATM